MKKFGGLLNKLTNNNKPDEDSLRGGDVSSDEELDPNYRKTISLDSRNAGNEDKIKKPFSLRSLSPFKPQETLMATDDDFVKAKSSSMRTMPSVKPQNDKEKLTESDDTTMRKSFSLRNVTIFKTQDQRPSSLKGIFASQYEQHRNASHDFESDDENDEFDEEVQAVPKRTRHPHRNATERDNFDNSPAAPMRVPSHPLYFAPSPPAAVRISPSPPPALVPSPPAAAQPAQVPIVPASSHSLNTEDFDAQFGRMRTDSITDDYGAQYGRERAESVTSDADNDGRLIAPTNSSRGIFASFGATNNKSRKIK